MAGGERVGAEVARGVEQVGELHPLVAAHARHGGEATTVGVHEIVDDRGSESALVVEHIMWDAEAPGDAAGVVDVPPRAAAAAGRVVAAVEQLECEPDDFTAGLDEQRSGGGAVDAARHGDGDASAGARQIEVSYMHGVTMASPPRDSRFVGREKRI